VHGDVMLVMPHALTINLGLLWEKTKKRTGAHFSSVPCFARTIRLHRSLVCPCSLRNTLGPRTLCASSTMEVSDSSTPLNSTRSRVVRLLLASSHEPVEVIRRKGVVKFNPSFFEMVRHRASARCAKRLCAERRLCADGSPL